LGKKINKSTAFWCELHQQQALYVHLICLWALRST